MEQQKFKIVSEYKPTGDQPEAIKQLVKGLNEGKDVQVLLGATGTGKTFTVANVIEQVQRPTLVLVHNKTLAGQLYAEFKELFPHNRVEYFVSNFDFYQPEAYVPKSDTYIEKNAVTNEEIEQLRVSSINSILARRDTIIVASVASIYGLTDPLEYKSLVFEVRIGEQLDRKEFINRLIDAQYTRTNMDLFPGAFRIRGDIYEVFPMDTGERAIRIDTFGDEIESISEVNTVTGEVIHRLHHFPIYPAYDHASTREKIKAATTPILKEMEKRVEYFRQNDLLIEAQRIEMRTRQDVESLLEFGMVPGIENYSRHIDGRKEGERPYCLIDYFPEDLLVVVDESHVTLPQIRGMYNGDRSRKETLVEYGFRLPSALDNRPLKFEEFVDIVPQMITTSATPGDYELERTNNKVVEQIIRPTGLVDPHVEVRRTLGQIDDLVSEIKVRNARNERTLVITLTIKMAEDLTYFLKQQGFKVAYLHNETKTLERTEIIYELRKGKYDVLVGINLLREGLDIPEVSLIAILDADKEGFLRSERSLIQIIGRAARNINGLVIMYADKMTRSMENAIKETDRRRAIQEKYNLDNGIVPQSIIKEIRPPVRGFEKDDEFAYKKAAKMSLSEKREYIKNLRSQMHEAARNLDFEQAAILRDIIIEINEEE